MVVSIGIGGGSRPSSEGGGRYSSSSSWMLMADEGLEVLFEPFSVVSAASQST